MSGFELLQIVLLLAVLAALLYVAAKYGVKWLSGSAFPASDSGAPKSPDAREGESAVPAELDVLFGSLADHLLALRISGASQAVYSAAWQVVDDLVILLPKLAETYGKSELTFVLTQIGKKYLPNLIVPYGKLSSGAQQEKESELLSTLAVLSEEVQKVQGIYDRGEVNSFETEAIFLRNKFLGETIEAE